MKFLIYLMRNVIDGYIMDAQKDGWNPNGVAYYFYYFLCTFLFSVFYCFAFIMLYSFIFNPGGFGTKSKFCDYFISEGIPFILSIAEVIYLSKTDFIKKEVDRLSQYTDVEKKKLMRKSQYTWLSIYSVPIIIVLIVVLLQKFN